MESKEQRTWSQGIARSRELRQSGNALAFERACVLVAVYRDDEFRAHCIAHSINATEYLDAECDDIFAAGFEELRMVLETFPREEQWRGKKLNDLLREAADIHASAARESESEPRNRPSWKEKYLDLKDENEELRRENLVLRTRIDELEKILNAHMQRVA